MDAATAGLIGTAIGAVTGFAGTILTGQYNLEKERHQWHRTIEQERQKWQRDNIQEIYSNCLYYLARILMASEVMVDSFGQQVPIRKEEHHREFFSDYSEAQRWLEMLLIHHPFRTAQNPPFPITPEYNALCTQIHQFSGLQMPNLNLVKPLRVSIVNLAARDPRVQT